MSSLNSMFGFAEILGLLSSLLFASTMVSLRQGMRLGSPLAAVLVINTVVSLGGFMGSLIRGTIWTADIAPLLYFATMGLVGPGIGSICRMMGVVRMGLSPSTLVASSTPIWGTMLAVLILGEEPTARVLLGTVFIVGGVSLLAFEDRDKESQDFRKWFRTALIFPVVASFAYAVAPIFIKLAYGYQKTPMLGIGVGFCVGNILLLLAKPILPGGGRIHAPLKSLAWYLLGGLFNFSAAICFMTALTFGKLSSILPVSRLTPLWVVLLSYIFLRKIDRITGLIIMAAALVVVGGVIISIR